MNALHRAGLLVAASATLFLAACGGSGGSAGDSAPTPSPAPTPAPVAFEAVGTSDRTASLVWQAPAAAETWTVERRPAGGTWAPLAQVDARQGGFADDGLAADTAYEYRIVATGTGGSGHTVAAASATTTAETPVGTAIGTPLGDAVSTPVGAAGGRLASADGRIVLDVPAGAFAAATGARVQPVVNTAPAGRGDGLRVSFDAAPTAPLTLTLKHAAEHDGVADGLRVAVQRADGTWLSLPLATRDQGARTLGAVLPPSFFGATPPGARAGANAASVSLEFTIVAYLAFELEPSMALVKVKTSLPLKAVARVRGYDTQIGTCVELDVSLRGCLMTPVMQTREIPFTNQKAGYERHWWVNAEIGGSASDGTVRADGAVGAVYTAPSKVPSPDTVIVAFTSKNLATGQLVTMTATVKIYDDNFTGMMEAIIGPSIAGTTYFTRAEVTWRLDPATALSDMKEYVAEGTLFVSATDDDCTVTMTPSSHAIENTVPALIRLKVDESRIPNTYTATLVTFWDGAITGVCPKASTTQPGLLGYGWEVSGTLKNNDTLIEGVLPVEGGTISWSFSR